LATCSMILPVTIANRPVSVRTRQQTARNGAQVLINREGRSPMRTISENANVRLASWKRCERMNGGLPTTTSNSCAERAQEKKSSQTAPVAAAVSGWISTPTQSGLRAPKSAKRVRAADKKTPSPQEGSNTLSAGARTAQRVKAAATRGGVYTAPRTFSAAPF